MNKSDREKIKEIIKKMKDDCPRAHNMIWIGKDYSKGNLIRDLENLIEVSSKG